MRGERLKIKVGLSIGFVAGRGCRDSCLRIRPVPGKERCAVTAEEIRNYGEQLRALGPERTAEAIMQFLVEIAAQLAELNASIQSFDRTDGTRIFDVNVREATR